MRRVFLPKSSEKVNRMKLDYSFTENETEKKGQRERRDCVYTLDLKRSRRKTLNIRTFGRS